MWTPSMIALDLDGTVVDIYDQIPQTIQEAIAAAIARDIHVVLATGRGWLGAKHHLATLSLPEGPQVLSNGAVIMDYPSETLVDATTFDPRDVIEQVRATHPAARFAVEEVGVGYLVSEPFPAGELGGELTVVPWERLWRDPVTRVIVRDPESSAEDFVRLAHHLGLEGVNYFVGWTAWLDLAPAGVNKASALAKVAASLGIDRADVLAVGDGRNDIEMLTWAGRGVAMGDAPAEVKAAADAVTGTFVDDGLVTELRRWV